MLMFIFVILQICVFTNVCLLNGDFYKNALNKGEYFTYVKSDIELGFNSLSMVTSIPKSVFSTSINDGYIKDLAYSNIDNMTSYMKSTSSYKEDKINTNVFESNVKKYIEDYSATNKIAVSSDLSSQITTISKQASDITRNHALLFNVRAVEKYSEFQSVRKISDLFYSNFISVIIIVIVLISLLAFLNRRRKRRTFFWVGSSLIPSSFMVLIPSILALIYKIPYRFTIGTKYIDEALKFITLGYIYCFLASGLILLFIGIFLLWLYNFYSKKASERRRTSKEEVEE